MSSLRLTLPAIKTSFILPKNQFFTLAIEHKGFLLKFLKQLQCSLEGQNEDLYLLENDKVLKFEKNVTVIFDLSHIDFNDKAIGRLLTKQLFTFLGQGEQAEALNNFEGLLNRMLDDFSNHSHLDIDYNQTLNADSLVKVAGLCIKERQSGLLEQLTDYVNLWCELKPLKLLVLVFAKQFLTAQELYSLLKHCYDKEVRMLLIEGQDKTPRIKCEQRLIMDENFCLITQGFELG